MATETLQLNLDDVALGDLEDFEEYTGMSFTVLEQLSEPGFLATVSTKVFTGIALLALRQQDADATIADARRVKMSELSEANPTVAEPEPLKPLSASKARRTKSTVG